MRVNGTQRATQWGYSLWDLNVYGTAGVAGADAAVAGPADRRVQRGDRQRARRRERGRRQHRHPLGQRLRAIHSGSPSTSAPSRSISRVRLNWEAAFARAYQIQISPDNATWTTVYSTTTGDGGVDDVTVTGTGRYVRVYGTQRALTQYGYSLWELEVFGV